MLHHRSHILCRLFLISDLLLTSASWIGAYYLRFESGWVPLLEPPPDPELCWRNLPLVILLSAVAYELTGQYVIHRFRRFREEMVAVAKGSTLLLLLVTAFTFLSDNHYDSRATLFLFFVLTAASVLSARRLGWEAIRELRRRGYNQTRGLVVGTGRIARKADRALRNASFMGIQNVGFVEDEGGRWSGDLNVLGTIDDLPRLVEEHEIFHVFIALPLRRFHEARRVFDLLSRSMVEVRLVADVPNCANLSLTTNNLDGLPIIGLRESPHFGLNIVVKRGMDIATSLAALLALSPLLLLIGLFVKLTSKGPVFYRQERCGLNGRSFGMFKFRSMYRDAEADSGAVWASTDDPRRTPLGRILRRTSLDELPQLINVLKGDMSLVGPRPERPVFIQKFRRTVPNYMARHCVKSGITGWAQVHGWRGNTSLRKRVQYDLYYITHWTPWLDLHILWMTLWHGLFHKNAY